MTAAWSSSAATWTPASGIDAAVAGAEVIVHCAGAQKGDGDKARALVRAACQAPRGVRLRPWAHLRVIWR